MYKRRAKQIKNLPKTKFEKFLDTVWRELRFDSKNMINFILFYKPTSKGDKILHIFEMVLVYVVLQLAVKGVFN